MRSIFEALQRFGGGTLVVKAIAAAVAGNVLLIGFILLRRAYRKRYFAKHDARVFKFREQWEAIVSGKVPYKSWRKRPFDRRIVEEIALNELDTASSTEALRLLYFLRRSGLIEKRIFEATKHRGWRRHRALVALGRTRAPEGIHALAEGLRDPDKENRHAALRGLGRMAAPEAAEAILGWVVESGLRVETLPLQNALINCCRERPQVLVPYLEHATGEVREVLARVMGEVATAALDMNLLDLAEDNLAELRAAAARAMPSTNRYRALEVLGELAKDRVWYVRLRAVVALGRLNNPEAVPHIVHALKDASRMVRARAGEALIAQRGDLLGTFKLVVATRDRYGLHAYLAALENAALRPKLEEELKKDASLEAEERARLEAALRSGEVPKAETAAAPAWAAGPK